jgi:branched-chain amino acid transport system substrate-binding protein
MTDAQQIAQTVGIVVGAASCCEQVTEERVNAVAVKLRELIAAAADDDSDADLANEQFSAALEEGKTAVESGRIDPERAEVDLNELEQKLSTY